MFFYTANSDFAGPNNPDLTVVSPGFLGQVRTVTSKDSSGNDDGGIKVQICLYNATGAALTKGGVYVIQHTNVQGQTPQVQTPGAVSGVPRLIAVATSATAAAVCDWFDVAGDVDALVDGSGSAVTAGNNLKVAPGTNALALIQDTGSGASNETASTLAVSTAAVSTSNVLTRVKFYGLARVVNT